MEPSEQKPAGLIWLLIILVLVGFAAAVTYFERNSPDLMAAIQSSANYPTPSRQARVYTVYYGLGVFSPTNIRIHAGDSVKFQNDSNFPLRVISDSTDGVLDLAGFSSVGDVPPGGAFSFTFSEAGTFGYHNDKNPAEEGAVVVRP